MANMVPPQPPPAGSKPGIDSEREFFFALEHQLGNDWWVYHGLEYIEPTRAEEGETDFLLVHRTKGLYVVECKGHGVERESDGTWTRRYHGRKQRMHQSPMEQAQDQVHDLSRALTARVRKVWPDRRRLPFRFGHGVTFPSRAFAAGEMPLDIPDALFFDAVRLSQLSDRVNDMVEFWERKGAGFIDSLDEPEFRRFREELLAPELRLVSNLSTRVAGDRRALLRLNRQQVQVIDGLLDNPRLCVEGGAGTGKTVIALEASRLYGEDGLKVLLLCFNKGLGHHLNRLAKGFTELPGFVDAMHFHRLCALASHSLDRGDLDVPEGKEAATAFWNTDAPLVLLEAVEAGAIGPWDAIVIDEGQDFAANWWPVVDSLLASEDSHLLICQDTSQAIFDRRVTDHDYPTYRLTRNLRNTKAIARVVERLSDTEMQPHRRAPEGIAPIVTVQPSRSKLHKHLNELITTLTTDEGFRQDQIVILTPHSLKNSSLSGLTELGGIPIVDLKDRRSSAITHATISAFKGLESDVLILVDIDAKDERCDRKARYVAVSRCRHLLYVFARGDWLG
jgi:hypothetical protein